MQQEGRHQLETLTEGRDEAGIAEEEMSSTTDEGGGGRSVWERLGGKVGEEGGGEAVEKQHKREVKVCL